ncbi:polyphosphate kinase 2 [Brevundimonas nasdae]|uniref:ADP/GDP-polyphosphate phosphotransferase n=1 Tax=Brevundimonas nasdae TaxID=172043 RepID=A0ABX8TDV2_9CAUL|nr:polyphosphate kinase 2 [Brevundimonas nasdae]MBK6023488.1 polyphosphate kinase 2 [Brevundimonas nasdae]MDQ0450137.1 polyphosphate kinase 2 [Brevundimonas nasdae]QYC09367.1 polyphosphate kinase 2 [Brevundimonas nasdae]QYC15415.1 polyphosphate kinase 2 [Brevundimonas nasdae]
MGKKSDAYATELEQLQLAIVETQSWTIKNNLRVVIVLEGRDTAGKDGAIKRLTEYMSPRQTRVVALPKPSDRETSQWYFQRYVPHLPAAGETVIFNRSWYNRGGVEPVMGYCTPEQYAQFMTDAPRFERMLTDDGIILIKIWLDISRKEQAKRLKERRVDPLKQFKLSSLDAEAEARFDAYSDARDRMLDETDRPFAPWTVIATDDKKTARLNLIRYILSVLDHVTQDVKKPDPDVVLTADRAKGKLAR